MSCESICDVCLDQEDWYNVQFTLLLMLTTGLA